MPATRVSALVWCQCIAIEDCALLQPHVQRPLLIDGCKFHIRQYLLVVKVSGRTPPFFNSSMPHRFLF